MRSMDLYGLIRGRPTVERLRTDQVGVTFFPEELCALNDWIMAQGLGEHGRLMTKPEAIRSLVAKGIKKKK